jgi:hypothetical protein
MRPVPENSVMNESAALVAVPDVTSEPVSRKRILNPSKNNP